ncbi:ABC transporter substrate-binding protein [Deinococcus ficus]|uniref:Peptide ABC transporter substrate-binding protein n=1 Tax=Deinococcus ficus TaxID=317577 RepID=A0A221T2J7_9DEIO|nr:ABC transporter substrate-binding protein [Deinococcus ficus]ASN83147.1 peptide ABC transporter substrate-binding protein [Deinococcus ficus]
MHKALLTSLSLALLVSTAHATAPKDTLVMQWASDITTLDPAQAYDGASFAVTENLYDTLVTYAGSNLKTPVPSLATRWTIRPDGRQYTFDLRKNVKFHSGNAFACADAEYSLRRMLVTNHAESGIWYVAESLLGTGSNANDDKSVTWAKISAAVKCNAAGQLVLTLPKADPALLSKLASQNTAIVDRVHAVRLGDWNGTESTWKAWIGKDLTNSVLHRQPSGTGAYRLVRRDAQSLLAVRFDGYWGKAAPLKNVVLQLVPEEAARLAAFNRCDADIIELDGRASLVQVKSMPQATIVDGLPDLATPVIAMNQDIKDPALLGSGKLDGRGIPANFFADLNVRRAFNFAFDRTRYVREITDGTGLTRTMALPPSFLGYDEKIAQFPYSPARAAEEFKKAFGGRLWQNGFVLNVTYRSDLSSSQTTMELLKQSVEAINPKFRVNLLPLAYSELLAASKEGKTTMVGLLWSPDYLDPDNIMYTLYSSEGYYAPRTSFKDAQIDAMLERARTITDAKAREALYQSVGARAQTLAPYILLPSEPNFVAYCRSLKGISKATFNPMLGSLSGVYWRNLSK